MASVALYFKGYSDGTLGAAKDFSDVADETNQDQNKSRKLKKDFGQITKQMENPNEDWSATEDFSEANADFQNVESTFPDDSEVVTLEVENMDSAEMDEAGRETASLEEGDAESSSENEMSQGQELTPEESNPTGDSNAIIE